MLLIILLCLFQLGFSSDVEIPFKTLSSSDKFVSGKLKYTLEDTILDHMSTQSINPEKSQGSGTSLRHQFTATSTTSSLTTVTFVKFSSYRDPSCNSQFLESNNYYATNVCIPEHSSNGPNSSILSSINDSFVMYTFADSYCVNLINVTVVSPSAFGAGCRIDSGAPGYSYSTTLIYSQTIPPAIFSVPYYTFT